MICSSYKIIASEDQILLVLIPELIGLSATFASSTQLLPKLVTVRPLPKMGMFSTDEWTQNCHSVKWNKIILKFDFSLFKLFAEYRYTQVLFILNGLFFSTRSNYIVTHIFRLHFSDVRLLKVLNSNLK